MCQCYVCVLALCLCTLILSTMTDNSLSIYVYFSHVSNHCCVLRLRKKYYLSQKNFIDSLVLKKVLFISL